MRIKNLLGLFNPVHNANMDITDDKKPAHLDAAAVQPVIPAPTFEQKLAIYAEQGRKKGDTILHQDDDTKLALKSAAAEGDTAFLRTALERRPDIAKNITGYLLKETLTQAIVNKHPQTVSFLLEDAGVDPQPCVTNQFGKDESYKHPQWDALFVAATGVIPHDFIHTPGKVWQIEQNADVSAIEIFDTVLSAYTYKYRNDPQGLLSAISENFSMPNNNVYWGGDYNVGSTSSSYASTLGAARPNLAPVLESCVRSLKVKIAAEADKNRGFDLDSPA